MELKSRRKLLQTGVAAALLAASGVPVSARTRHGRLRVGLSDFASDLGCGLELDHSLYGAVAGQGAVYDTLTELSADGALKGELAQSWAPSENARVWTFTLRDAVRFHDGVMLSAEVVADAFARHREAQTQASILSTVLNIRAVSRREVRFILDGSNPDFPWYLTDPSLVVTRPAPVGGEAPVGTGLYQFVSGTKGGRVLAQRVPQHYKDGHAGWFEEIELVSLPDDTDRAEALLSGRIDVTHDLLPETLGRFQRDHRFGVRIAPDARYISFECRGRQPTQLKAALDAAISRDQLVSDALGPLGRTAYDHPFPGSAASATSPGFAPHELQSISIGVAPGLGAIGARVVAAFCDQLQAGGTRVRLASSLATADVVARRLPVRPLEDWAWLDWTRYADSGYNNLADTLSVARSTLDPQERTARYARVTSRASEISNIFVPCYVSNAMVYARNLAHSGPVGSDLDLDGARIAERWWRA
ncbi:MAG: ABC transporter substrate-binding protein [Dinoroseobacter sp.]|nr:ABC transporter substrate-binding protein [Dinoroseobacter sp.]